MDKRESVEDSVSTLRLKGLALNPAAPDDVILRILNSSFDKLKWVMVRRCLLSGRVYDAIVGHRDSRIRRLLAGSPAAPLQQRIRLSVDPDPRVRELVAQGPEALYRWERVEPLPTEIALELARDPEPRVRQGLGASTPIADEVSALLVRDSDPMVRLYAYQGWPAAPTDVTERLLHDQDAQVRLAAEYVTSQQDEELAYVLFRERQPHLWKQHIPDAALNRRLAEWLVRNDDIEVRTAVAANLNLPSDLVAELAKDDSVAVRLAVSVRPELSEQERALIDYQVTATSRIFPPPWLRRSLGNIELMCEFASSAHIALRRFSAYSPHLTQSLIEKLARDEDPIVRLLLAENNPNAPGELLLRTMLESELITRYELLHAPNFPSSGLIGLADDGNPIARSLAVRDPDAPAGLIDRLSWDADAWVRAAAAGDARLSVERVLDLLQETPTAESAARNPNLPIGFMGEILAQNGI